MNTQKQIKSRSRRRRQGMTEYVIVVGLVAIVMVAAVDKFSDSLGTTFVDTGEAISTISDEWTGKGAKRAGNPGP